MKTARKAKKTKKARKPNPGAVCSYITGLDGKRHLYLNEAFAEPRGKDVPRHVAVCPVCGLAYAHLLETPEPQCRECEEQDITAWGREVEMYYEVKLGWGRYSMLDPHTKQVEFTDIPAGRIYLSGNERVNDNINDNIQTETERHKERRSMPAY